MKRREFLVAGAGGLMLAGCATASAMKPFTSQRISVETRGSGPDVILIPGLATSREVWADTVRAMPEYRFHLVEVSGVNGTDPRANRASGPLVRALADEVARYIDEQRLVRPAIVGHSLGGLMALVIAAGHPQLLGKAMVVDMVPFNGMNFGGPNATVESVRSIAPVARERYFGTDEVRRRLATEQLYAAFIQTPSLRPVYIQQALLSDPELAGRLFEETFSLDLRDEIQTIRVPLTVVYTRAPNQPVENDATDEMYRLGYAGVRHAALKRVNDAGHFIMLDQPERFRADLRDFLR